MSQENVPLTAVGTTPTKDTKPTKLLQKGPTAREVVQTLTTFLQIDRDEKNGLH